MISYINFPLGGGGCCNPLGNHVGGGGVLYPCHTPESATGVMIHFFLKSLEIIRYSNP